MFHVKQKEEYKEFYLLNNGPFGLFLYYER